MAASGLMQGRRAHAQTISAKAVTTLEDIVRIARRVLAAHAAAMIVR